ncbi:MAG: OsmC family protein [Ichthyobacteriaceae bacterium]|nr:OsmC family protein [Ichthyobacteriaceae bacterium]
MTTKMDIEVKFGENGRIIPFIGGREITMNESPFLIFLATAGMCSAVYVQAFMQQRGMSTDDVTIIQRMDYNQGTNMVEKIDMILDLPESFPAKYSKAIKNVVGQCNVKQHLDTPPTFEVTTSLDKVEA